MFVIQRKEIVRRIGDCALIDVFDRRVRLAKTGTAPKHYPTVNERGDLVYPEGWQAIHTAELLEESPRALWLMSQAGLLPIAETAALQMIDRSGKAIEPATPPVAKVRHVKADASQFLLVHRLQSRSRHAVVKPPARVITIE